MHILKNEQEFSDRENFKCISSTSYFFLYPDIFSNNNSILNQSTIPQDTNSILENRGAIINLIVMNYWLILNGIEKI